MGEKEKAFRERIARIHKIQNQDEITKQCSKEIEEDSYSEILPAICGVKKSIENFRNNTKEIIIEER